MDIVDFVSFPHETDRTRRVRGPVGNSLTDLQADLSFASRVIVATDARLFETGHRDFASLAISWNLASVIPLTTATTLKSILVIVGPFSPGVSVTEDFASICFAGVLLPSNNEERNIAKHPACAAPISSSGFVEGPCSNLDIYSYGPEKAPLSTLRVPLPLFNPPDHDAVADRVGIFDFHHQFPLGIRKEPLQGLEMGTIVSNSPFL